MNEPEWTEWQIRCAFNGFCKRTLKNESINAHKELRKRQAHEINSSDLTPKEENQLYTCEDFFAENKEEQTFSQAEENPTANWVILNGNRIQIKRRQFEKMIDAIDTI